MRASQLKKVAPLKLISKERAKHGGSVKKAQDGAAMKTDSNRPPSLDKSKMSKKQLRAHATDSMRVARAANKAKKK